MSRSRLHSVSSVAAVGGVCAITVAVGAAATPSDTQRSSPGKPKTVGVVTCELTLKQVAPAP